MKLRFLSGNPHKIQEVKLIFDQFNVDVAAVDYKIEEIQTENVENLVKDKCIKAFQKIGRPLFVEHTGLYISALNGFPAGLTQIFWDTLKADRVSELFGKMPDTSVIAKTRIGYCDGRKILQFEGSIEGNIAPTPEGNRDFQWDCVFIPKGYEKTFAQLGDKKNEISMRRKALEELGKYLKANPNV